MNKEIEEIIFENYINKTIIFSSKRYYKSKMTNVKRESNIEELISDVEKNRIISIIDKEYARCEIKLIIENFLEQLEDIEREVIVLSYLEDYSNGEISKILGLNYKSISRIKVRAIKKIRENFKGGMIDV